MAQTPFSFMAPSTGNYIIEGFGSGAGGRSDGGNGNGGGGAAYARTAGVALIGGNNYSGAVGDPGISNNNGDGSEFTTVMYADRGWNADFRGFGFGGLASNCVGDVAFDGGNGDPSAGAGGGGGGCADDGNVGNNAIGSTGGPATPRGGKGGDGPIAGVGNNGDAPGGGGSGGTSGGGGLGGNGAVVIWHDLGVWPPTGQTPVQTYGGPVPSFPNNPKARKTVSIM
jgi:hypothetical protein